MTDPGFTPLIGPSVPISQSSPVHPNVEHRNSKPRRQPVDANYSTCSIDPAWFRSPPSADSQSNPDRRNGGGKGFRVKEVA